MDQPAIERGERESVIHPIQNGQRPIHSLNLHNPIKEKEIDLFHLVDTLPTSH